MKLSSESDLEQKIVTVFIEGRINTATAQEFSDYIRPYFSSFEKLILDFSKVDFISSAGLRILVDAQLAMKGHTKLAIKNVSDEVKDVLNMTGFIELLKID